MYLFKLKDKISMLTEMYKYIINNENEIKDKLNPSKTEEISKKARSMWNKFPNDPSLNNNYKLIGIDSSFNLIPYDGFYLYAINCVAVNNDGSFASEPKCEIAIGTLEYKEGNTVIYNPKIALSSKCMELEYKMIKECINKADLILVDGSLQARMYDKHIRKMIEFYEYSKDILGSDDIIFIAKRTDSREILNGNAGDIYYFNHATQDAGYSKPRYDNGITIVYTRFADNLPCIKVEFTLRADVQMIVDRLLTIKNNSLSGYPYILKLAHDSCKISNDDMYKIATFLGIREVKGRGVLENE